MLTPEQVKPLLLHEDRDVRGNASRYFTSSGSLDTEVVDLSLQALLKYDYNKIMGHHLVFNLRTLPAGPSSVPLFLASLEKYDRESVLRDLNWALARLPLELWDAHREELESAKKIEDGTKERVARRRSYLARDGFDLFEELDEFSQSNHEKAGSEIDHSRLEDLLEAMASKRNPEQFDLMDILKNQCDPDERIHSYLAELTGIMRLNAFVPLLVEYLSMDEYEVLQDAAQQALSRIGEPAAIDLICVRFIHSSWEFKLYASGVLGAIHDQRAEKAILNLLQWERDCESRVHLCMALGDQFSLSGIGAISRELRDGKDLPAHAEASLEGTLLPLALALNVDIPEHKALMRKRDAIDTRIQDLEQNFGISFPTPADENWDEEGGDLVLPDRFTHGAIRPVAPLAANREPRPNATCPCGSGKKYKKCCGT